MAATFDAILAEWRQLERNSFIEHPENIPVFADGLMFPQIRAALFRMALITGFIDRVLDQIAAGTTVRVVTV